MIHKCNAAIPAASTVWSPGETGEFDFLLLAAT